jgi:hypothetical protein
MNITIPINRKRAPIAFLISLALTIFITYGLLSSITDELFLNGLFHWLFCIIPISITVTLLIDYIKTRFDKNARITITNHGINDNLSILSSGNISWDDISGHEIVQLNKTRLLIIKLHDNLKYLKQKNFIQRYIQKSWLKKWGSPIVISELRIDYNFQDLVDIISNRGK